MTPKVWKIHEEGIELTEAEANKIARECAEKPKKRGKWLRNHQTKEGNSEESGESDDATAGEGPDPTDPNIPGLCWSLCALKGEERQRLSDVLHKHRHVFNSKETPRLGLIKGFEFTIDTGDNPPVRSRPFRVKDPRLRKAMSDEIDRMLAEGIIVPLLSAEWVSPALCVWKPDGTIRFCVDYRAMNSATKPDPYPTPDSRDIMDSMAQAHIMSSLDLNSGYWQI